MTNKLNAFQLFPEPKINKTLSNKGSRLMIAAFLLLMTTFPFMGCESGGSVGSDIIPNNDGIDSQTVGFNEINRFNENNFSGRLTNTSVGYVEDPLYGTIESVALIKPVIIRASDLGSIQEDDKMQLRLEFRDEIFGNRSATSEFKIYEVGELWRGNQLRYNGQIDVDRSVEVGEFQLQNEQAITVDLSDEWTQKFAEFYNSESADRDSTYRNNFTGLAIVPSQTNQNLRFLRTGSDPDDPELVLTRFIVNSPVDETDDDEESDDGVTELSLRDWGASYIRTDVPEQNSGFTLHSTETILELIPNISSAQFSSRNISNATLVLTKNQNVEQLQPDFERLSPDIVQLHVFEEKPSDIMAEVFTNDPDFFRINEDDEDVFLVDITQYVLNRVYGERSDDKLYLTTQISNGLLYSTQFYDLNAPEELRPRIVITFIK
tara:strand:+ start:6878 stop:8179 length:1302 start_codon:yes stop_codon:yes gene_type:complete